MSLRAAMLPLLLLAACRSVQPTWDLAEPGTWFGADLHVHTSIGSNDTDGVSMPADHAAIARERGLSLLVITDHSNSAGSMEKQ